MPHTIIDINKPLAIPAGHLVWGLITDKKDLETNSISINAMSKINTRLTKGNMFFEGSGESFVSAFQHRIQHILEANGAFFNCTKKKGQQKGSHKEQQKGHAQKNQNMAINTIQPYPRGKLEGLYPTISIKP
jgi:hypothetical protein